MTAITWYAMNTELNTVERGQLDLPAALLVIDDYIARLKPKYDSGEEAMAQTMFGFSRTSNDFIEICVHTPTEISFKTVLPRSPTGGFLAKLRGSFEREQTLRSRDALRRHVTAYFTMAPEQFKAHVQASC